MKDDDELIIIANTGKMIRIDLNSVRVTGRTTQGVTLINLEADEKVVGIDCVAKDSSEKDLEQEEI